MKTLFEFITEAVETNPVEVKAFHGSGRHFKSFSKSAARVKNDFYGGGIGYFTDNKKVSHTYAKSMARTQKGEPHIYHTTLKMNNVFDVDHKFSGEKLKHVLPDDHEKFARGAGLLKYGDDRVKVIHNLRQGKTELTGDQVFKGLSRGGVESDKARTHLQNKGYDGLRYNGGDNMHSGKHNVYIPYNKEAITIHKITKLVKKPAALEEELIHRGISHKEYKYIQRTGKIQSKGENNIGTDQEGLTYFSTSPHIAKVYATKLGGVKPSETSPAYIISVKKPSKSKIKDVEGTGTDEVGIKTAIPASHIVNIKKTEVKGKTILWKKIK